MSINWSNQAGRREFLKLMGSLAGSSMLPFASQALAADSINFFTWSAAVDTVKSHLTAFEKKYGMQVAHTRLHGRSTATPRSPSS